MTSETQIIERYLEATLGVTARLAGWGSAERLPLFLRDGYRYYQANLLGAPCLFMVDRTEDAPSPGNVRKHLDQVRSKWDGELVYVRGQLASHQRRRLIEQRVPFLVPGNQMYLPMLGIDLREHFRRQRQTPLALKPATQALILHLVLHRDEKSQTPAELAERLGYTKMTMSRAFDELEVEQLCDVFREGRERWLRLKGTRHELWTTALPLMRSPVKQRKYVERREGKQFGLISGLSALAKYSMLAAPKKDVVALSPDAWKEIRQESDRTSVPSDDPDAIEVEVWTYDPQLFTDERVVDRLSLFLSLKDNADERVETALDEMMEAVPW